MKGAFLAMKGVFLAMKGKKPNNKPCIRRYLVFLVVIEKGVIIRCFM